MSPALNSKVVPLSEVPVELDELELENEEAREPVVLIVDDERMVADTLALIFKRAGLCALTAYDAKGALEVASAIVPDLLVSDVDMPGMNGVDLALTMLERIPSCRVLLFSGHATHADLAPAVAEGHDFPLLPKPVHPAVMLDNVAKCLDGRKARKARYADVFVMPEMRRTA
jgi:DNA-binding NtrC family response regulator